jgi:hypothetical protein
MIPSFLTFIKPILSPLIFFSFPFFPSAFLTFPFFFLRFYIFPFLLFLLLTTDRVAGGWDLTDYLLTGIPKRGGGGGPAILMRLKTSFFPFSPP